MVVIIKGTFGYYDGHKVVPVSKADGPQKWDEALEARLVARGIARYVDEPEKAVQASTAHDEAAPAEKDLAEMSYKELKALAKERGITGNLKKAELIAALEEEPPVFDAGDAIV